MGMWLIDIYNNKIKKEWKLAFYSAFVIGLLVHAYKFTNLLPNSDSLSNFYNSQNMVQSGRWLLSIACGFSSYFDLPWVNGILSLFFMGITAAIICYIFQMKNPVLIIVSSGLLVTFPAITETMFFEFTADGYMLSMALAALSVAITRMDYMDIKLNNAAQNESMSKCKQMHIYRPVLGGVCLCLACGIYQAYIPFAFVLAIAYFITEVLEQKRENKIYRNWIIIQILMYSCALAAFYIIWKICLACQNIQPTSYQGIGGAGLISVHEIPNALFKIVRDNIRFYLEWNIFDHGITVYSALNILFLTAFAVGIIVAIYKSGCWKKPRTLILLGLCVVSFPFGCFIWHFASAWVYYHTIMLQCICVIYILTGVLWDRWCCQDNHRADAVLLLLTAIVFNNSVAANICYNYFHQAFIKTQAIVAEMNTRIHLLDDGNVRYIAFSGALDNWGQDACFDQKQLRQLGPLKSIPKRMLSSYYMSLYSEFDLTYYRANDIEYPLQEMADESAAPRDYVFRFPQRSYIEQLELGQTDEVKNMPIWPAADSVKVIGDTIVIKLSEDIDIFG